MYNCSMGNYIDQLFYDFDYSLLAFFHELALKFGNVLTPVSKFLAIIGNLPFLLLGYVALILIFTKKYRKNGIVMLASIILGAIITSLVIKPFVYRLRPYQSDIEVYKTWWQYVGSNMETDSSFPSGHSCAAASGALGLFLSFENKKYVWPILIYPILMACSRIYLCVHYPSDVVAGLIVGCFCAIISNLIINKIYIKKYSLEAK